ncbi:MAG: flagellar export protein FliJ [Gammaproteobacteria bacterium]|nr:flagellar export protein FliJ [Gammaproteobacteria bacterium]
MKKKSTRMQPLKRVAESKEHRAATELGMAQQQLQTQVNRLAELENYRNEYFSRFRQTGQNGVAVETLQSFRHFLDKLETAVEQQKLAVRSAGELVDQCKRRWFTSRDNVKIYSNVINRFFDQEHKQEEKHEQKESDDRAQRSS